MISSSSKLALLMEGYVRQRNGKMGFGLLRYGQSVAGCEITCVVAPDEVGQDLRALTGIDTDVPIVGSVEEARAMGADTLVIAVATSGGVLPDIFRAHIVSGLQAGMSLVNGLHGRYADIPEFAAALQPGASIWDVRLEPAGLRSGRGLAKDLPCRRVLTVGTDMAIGKMTASLELDRAARARGLRSKFLATGQIGICISGDGVPLDAVRVDFASGSIEMLCEKYGQDNDVLWVEGQGSALHPGSTAWVPLMRGSMPTDLILVHKAGTKQLENGLDTFPIPPLNEVVELYEAVAAAGPGMPAAKVKAIALNCVALPDDEVDRAIAEVEDSTGLPCDDVVFNNAEKLLDALAITA